MKVFSKISAIVSVLILCLILAGCGTAELTDGSYTADVSLSGGSGRACIESAEVTIEGGDISAVIVWSSPNYSYMTVGGQRYEPVQKSGNSTFEIPVSIDEELPVTACTEAMSEPHEIEYSLYFDSSTFKKNEH
ncbi:MAG: hypothetical protein ACOX68_02800 [Candidatus Limivicinus sp.]|jgi:hypothetical protein